MRTGYSAANVPQFSFHKRDTARRAIAPLDRGMTCLVLVKHGESRSKLAWLVSDTGDASKAVWVPKAMVIVEQPSERGILVASMATAFAEAKRLAPRFIDPEQFNEATRQALLDAERRAARKRNFYRGHRTPNGRGMTQNAFC